MYYIIKRQFDVPLQYFIGFAAPKYIASKKNDTIIFEFIIDGKPVRKWVKKEEIILLTKDKDFFVQTMDQFKAVENTQKELVEAAKEKLNQTLETYTETINAELDEFNEIKNSSDIPCMLKDI
jgi:hypothetical protein